MATTTSTYNATFDDLRDDRSNFKSWKCKVQDTLTLSNEVNWLTTTPMAGVAAEEQSLLIVLIKFRMKTQQNISYQLENFKTAKET